MVYPGPHMLTVMGGPLYVNEQWSCSFRSTPNFGDTTSTSEGAILDISTAIASWFGTQTVIGRSALLGFVKHNRIGVDGKYTNAVVGERFWEPPTPRTSPTNQHPPQIALAVTLETGLTRGLAHRGRMFLPAPMGAVDALGVLPAATATAAATAIANLFSTLNGVAGFGEVSVYSDVREGATNVVTGISCGRVLDTMRSRRAQLDEERGAPVAVTGF